MAASSSSTATLVASRPAASEGPVRAKQEPVNTLEEVPLAQGSVFLLSAEGASVFTSWKHGGFSDAQVRRLYGVSVLESFIAHRLLESQEAEA